MEGKTKDSKWIPTLTPKTGVCGSCRVLWLVGSCPACPFTGDLTAHAQAHPSEPHSPQGVDEVELWELMQMEDSRSKTRDQEMGLLMISGGCQVVKVSFFIQEVPGSTGRVRAGYRVGAGVGVGLPSHPEAWDRAHRQLLAHDFLLACLLLQGVLSDVKVTRKHLYQSRRGTQVSLQYTVRRPQSVSSVFFAGSIPILRLFLTDRHLSVAWPQPQWVPS